MLHPRVEDTLLLLQGPFLLLMLIFLFLKLGVFVCLCIMWAYECRCPQVPQEGFASIGVGIKGIRGLPSLGTLN